jgi:PST family polysaccharide transporter
LFPAFAQMRHREEDTRGAYLTGLALMALVAFPIGAVLSGAADPFVRALFGDKWLPMIGVLQVLGLWSVARPLEHSISWYLNSHERAGLVGRVAVVLLPLLVVAIYVAAELGGIETVAWVMVGHVVVSASILMMLVRRELDVPFLGQLARLVGPTAGAVAAWLASRALVEAADMAPVAELVAAGAAGLAAYIGAIALIAPGLLREAKAKATLVRR